MRKTVVIIALLTALGIACAQPAWQNDVIIREGQNLSYEGTALRESSGSMINIWVVQASGENCLLAAKYTATGETVWQEPLLVKGGTDLKIIIRAASTSDGGTVICWIEKNNAFGYQLRAQKLSPTGKILWGPYGVSVCQCFGNRPEYMLAPDQDGGAYLFVNELPQVPSPSYAYACRFNSSGVDIWGPQHPAVSMDGYMDMESIASLPSGDGFVVAYRQLRSNYCGCVYQYFTSNGVSDWNISESGTSTEDGALQLIARGSQKVSVLHKSLPNSTGVIIRTIDVASGTWITSEASTLLFNPTPIAANMGFAITMMPDTDAVSLIGWYVLDGINHIDQLILNAQMQVLETRPLYSTTGRISSLSACDDANNHTFCLWQEIPPDGYEGCLKAQAVQHSGGALLYPASGLFISPALQDNAQYGIGAANGYLQAFYCEPGEETATLKHCAFDQSGTPLLPPAQEAVSSTLSGYAWPWQCLDIAGHAVNIYGDTRKQGESRLYYQQNDASGAAMFPSEGVLIGSSNLTNASFFDAIACPNDRFAVLFSDNGFYLQVWDLDGTSQYDGTGLLISSSQVSHARMALYEGDIYVCWSEAGSSTGNKISGQRISGGQPVWGAAGITMADNVVYFRGIGAPEGRYFLWSNHYPVTSISEVVGKRVDADGNTLSGWSLEGNIVFQANAACSLNPVYSALTGDDLLMFVGNTASFSVFAQRVNSGSELPWGMNGVLIHEPPHMVFGAYVDDQGIVIGLQHNSGSTCGMYMQCVNPDGSLMYPSPGLIMDGGNLYKAANISFGRYPNGALLAVWSASYDPGTQYTDLWYRHFNAEGQPQETAPQLLCGAPLDQQGPMVANPSGQTLYVAWADARAGVTATSTPAYGVHLQKLANSGSPNPDEPQAPSTLTLNSCQPNPFRESVRVVWTQKNSRPVQCDVYNVRGQLVKRFPPSDARAGEHYQVWNGEDRLGRQTATGIYIIVVRSGDAISSSKVVRW